jgi:hypothetical protein
MHRNREVPTPVSSSKPSGNAEGPMSAPPESGAGDDALLALERQFEVLVREFAILLRTDTNQNGKRKWGHGGDAGRHNSSPPSERSCELARAEDGTDNPAAGRLEQLEAALARLEPIERAIMATPAQTIVGLGVKARHAAYVISESWAEPLDKADWDRRAVRLLIEAVCVVAGRPLAMGEASEPWLGD